MADAKSAAASGHDVRQDLEACICNLRTGMLREIDALEQLVSAVPHAPRCVQSVQWHLPCKKPVGPPIPEEPSPPEAPARADVERRAVPSLLADPAPFAPFAGDNSQSGSSWFREQGEDDSALQQDVAVRLAEFRSNAVNKVGSLDSAASAYAPSRSQTASRPLASRSRLRLLMVEKEDIGRCFEVVFAGAILTSAALSGIEVHWRASRIGEDAPLVFVVLRTAYTLLFLIELLVRTCKVGCSQLFCRSQDRSWAWLDLIVVISGIVELGFDAVDYFSLMNGEAHGGQANLQNLRVLRMVRLVRMFRLQRIVGLVAALKTLVYSISVTLQSLFWALFLLCCIVYVFGLAFTMDAVHILEESSADEATRQQVRYYWGSLDRSMFTLFKSISGGVSWTDPLDPLQEMSTISAALFAVYIAFTYFAVLNVVTAVFCSSALETAQCNPELVARSLVNKRRESNKILLSLFGALDMDDSGTLTREEFRAISEDDMVRAYFSVLGIDLKDVWTLFLLMDRDKNGKVDLEEFMLGCQQLRGGATKVHIVEVSNQVAKANKRMKELLHMLKKEGYRGGATTAFLPTSMTSSKAEPTCFR